MQNKFSNILLLTYFYAHPSATSNKFSCNDVNRILGKGNHEFKNHPLNRHLGRARIAEGVIANFRSIVSNSKMTNMLSIKRSLIDLSYALYTYLSYW